MKMLFLFLAVEVEMRENVLLNWDCILSDIYQLKLSVNGRTMKKKAIKASMYLLPVPEQYLSQHNKTHRNVCLKVSLHSQKKFGLQ